LFAQTGSQTVTNESELRAAAANASVNEILVSGNITTTSAVTFSHALTLKAATAGATITINGGVLSVGAQAVVIEGLTFIGSTSTNSGRAIEGGGAFTMRNCLVKGMRIADNGGAMSLSGSADFIQCIFVDNQCGLSASKNGGVMWLSGNETVVNVVNCAFYNNSATNRGGAIAILNGSTKPTAVNIYNTIALNNSGGCDFDTNTGELDRFRVYNSYYGSLRSNSGTATNCATDKTVADCFNNAASGDFTPPPGFAGINGGTTSGISSLIPATDFAGNTRVMGIIDIGPYETDETDLTRYLSIVIPTGATISNVEANGVAVAPDATHDGAYPVTLGEELTFTLTAPADKVVAVYKNGVELPVVSVNATTYTVSSGTVTSNLTLTVTLNDVVPYTPTLASATDIDWKKFLAQHDMYWTELKVDPTTNQNYSKGNMPGYNGGAIMGNGLLGVNMYKYATATSYSVYRFNAGRSDVTEVRPGYNLYHSARLPIGYFTLTTKGAVTNERMRLSLYDAITSGKFTTAKGDINFKTYVHALKNYIVFESDATGDEVDYTWNFVAQKAISPRYVRNGSTGVPAGYLDSSNNSNPAATTKTDGDYHLTIQKLVTALGSDGTAANGPIGKVYVVAWKQVKTGSTRRIIATIAQETTEEAAIASAKATIDEGFATASNTMETAHTDWWHALYPKSFMSFPNTKMESFYWIQLYKFASATRPGKPIVDLQGPWATYNTPWTAIWINLNLQLTYSWQVRANQGQLTEPLWEALNTYKDNLHRNVTDISSQATWTDAICFARTATYDFLAPLDPATVATNQYEVGNLTWLLFYYWQYCAYNADETEMTTRFFPLLKDAINLYFHIRTGKDSNGKWNLPPTASPEYQSTNIGANANYDLAILRWGLKTLLEIDTQYSLNDPKRADWQDFLDNLVDYPTDANGYKISSTVAIPSGGTTHRHYSHLFMIYPFHLVDWENPAENAVMTTSLSRWNGNQGYSYTGKAAMLASKGDGAGALSQLQTFLNSYINANTLYGETGPVFETPMAGASSIHELFLQDWGEKIRVFPAMPSTWSDASFIDLRANGAFLISATRKAGRTVFIQVQSEKGGVCKLQTGIASANLQVVYMDNTPVPFTVLDAAQGVIQVATNAGDIFQVVDKTREAALPEPIEHPALETNSYGVNSGPPDVAIEAPVTFSNGNTNSWYYVQFVRNTTKTTGVENNIWTSNGLNANVTQTPNTSATNQRWKFVGDSDNFKIADIDGYELKYNAGAYDSSTSTTVRYILAPSGSGNSFAFRYYTGSTAAYVGKFQIWDNTMNGGYINDFGGYGTDVGAYSVNNDSGNPVNFVFAETTSGIQTITAAPSKLAYPNPVGDRLYVRVPEGASRLTIANTTGQIVKQLNLSQSTESIPVSDLLPGMYIMKIGEKAEKIIKQ
jgi:hypothetical protein